MFGYGRGGYRALVIDNSEWVLLVALAAIGETVEPAASSALPA